MPSKWASTENSRSRSFQWYVSFSVDSDTSVFFSINFCLVLVHIEAEKTRELCLNGFGGGGKKRLSLFGRLPTI